MGNGALQKILMKTWASWRNFVAKDPSRCVTLTDLSERSHQMNSPIRSLLPIN